MNSSSSAQYRNPIAEQRVDLWVYKHTDGYCYFIASVPEFDWEKIGYFV